MDEMRERIESLLQAHLAERISEQEAIESEMAKLAERRDSFRSMAPQLYRQVIEDRLKVFTEYFDDAEYQEPPTTAHRGTVALNMDSKLDAQITFSIGIRADSQYRALQVYARLRVIPRLVDFERGGEAVFPIEGLRTDQVAAFVEREVVRAIETYLGLRNEPAYRRRQPVRDPVCKMEIDPVHAVASVMHDGRTYFFCARACQQEFLKAPGLYLGA